MTQEALDNGEDPLVTTIAKDRNFLHWIKVARSGSLGAREAMDLCDQAWSVAAGQYGADPALRQAVFLKASATLDEEEQAHAHET